MGISVPRGKGAAYMILQPYVIFVRIKCNLYERK